MLKNGHSLDNMGDKSSLLSNKRTVTVFLLCLELSYLKYENQRQKFKVVRLLFLRAFFFFIFYYKMRKEQRDVIYSDSEMNNGNDKERKQKQLKPAQ